ncbi:MAG: hypothetical protein EA376_13565 [Phycisphaeraceae bacterium]|nr:MAG: hypothetical protein EA376_13565 [Phycisphaeraceae bacterium]
MAFATVPFSGSGPGGNIPAVGTGGGGSWTSTGGPTVLPNDPFVSTISVPDDIKSVKSIEISGLTHTWIGDVQAVLVSPDNIGHNIFVRPGLFNPGTFGNSGDFLGGDYTFVESGGSDLPTSTTTAVNPPAGTYNQAFGVGAGMWPDGGFSIFNTPMGSISGGGGDWTLVIYDWAVGDAGALTGWTLNANLVPTPGAVVIFGLAGLAGLRRRR